MCVSACVCACMHVRGHVPVCIVISVDIFGAYLVRTLCIH